MSFRSGAIILSAGLALVLAGVVGSVVGGGGSQVAVASAAPSPSMTPTATLSPTATPSPTALPTPTPEPMLSPIVAELPDPPDDLLACGEPSAAAATVPGLDILSVVPEAADNPVTGEPASALRIGLAAPIAPETGAWSARVTIIPGPLRFSSADDLLGTQWIMALSDGQLGKSARAWDGSAWQEAPTEEFNVRYESFGDRAEVEFYGPPGTSYFGVLLGNGVVCDAATAAG